ncbi:MAG: glycosyltransferase family 2 protein [Planctomycetaceae bacterium]|jgi:glycosyltransferase involved in cell wall biosynthesis|nr:glycosyltransferase family 2 protein [Planctomycetaceae bacterium]
MTLQSPIPKVSVIIPVYNAEKYLHACLDSVVNQTLTNIQIICVDDGSSDSCPQILDEYAAKDHRITVIHQPNTGIAGARNVAYPFLKGEYTIFVDNDDTIEPDLCEKAVVVADAEQADTTYFFYDYGGNRNRCKRRYWCGEMKKLIGKQNLTEKDYIILLQSPIIWQRLWRTRFLLDNDIRGPVGQYCEDTFMSWQTIIHNPKMALLPEVMYHWRSNPQSASREPSKKYFMGLPITYDLIKEMLVKTGNYYGKWKQLFLYQKLWALRAVYSHLPRYQQMEFLRMVRNRIGQDEQEYLSQKNNLKHYIKVFYFALQGSHFAAAENAVHLTLRKAEITFRKFRDQWKKAG